MHGGTSFMGSTAPIAARVAPPDGANVMRALVACVLHRARWVELDGAHVA